MSDLLDNITEKALAEYDLLRDTCGLLQLDLGLVELTGDDRKGWLQGQATNDVRRLENGISNSFCFCAATGHILAVVEAWALSDRIVFATAPETVPDVMQRIEQMVIVEDVVGQHVSDSYTLLSIQGPDATQQLTQLLTLPSLDAGTSPLEDGEVFCLRSNRTGLGGWDIWIPKSAPKAEKKLRKAFKPIGQEAYDIARLEAGVPIFGRDMNHKTFPPELGGAFISRHVSYNKGCYMGQEVLMRIHSRGHTNRTWMGLISEEPLEVGATISHGARKEAGVVTSAAFSPDFGHIGAAMIRNEAAEERELVTVHVGEKLVEAEVRRMPLLRFE